jgi:hypothetical protein
MNVIGGSWKLSIFFNDYSRQNQSSINHEKMKNLIAAAQQSAKRGTKQHKTRHDKEWQIASIKPKQTTYSTNTLYNQYK